MTRSRVQSVAVDFDGVLLVTNRKLPAIAYIDDRAVRFTDWDQALREVGVE